ncbi:MAG: hypothetical protein ACJ8DJ_13195 [Gemmatimonadales bacterium]
MEQVTGAGRRSMRAGLTYVAVAAAGAGLFFMSFGAIFTGAWTMLGFLLLGYAGVGACAVQVGAVRPGMVALLLAVPAVPWVSWLFPASIPEAGLPRALLWPALVLLMGGLGWLGGRAVIR